STTTRNPSSSSSAFFSANQSPFLSPKSRPPSSANDAAEANVDDDPCCSPRLLSSDDDGDDGDRSNKKRGLRTSFSPCRPSSCDVYIGFHGRKPLLLRFADWLRAELESHGFNCFAADRARCGGGGGGGGIVEKAIDSCAFGVVILTKRSFRNPYTIEELRFFSGKKNLVPLYFDLSPDDCLARDIVERRGEIWEKHGGELWLLYGGLEKEWRDAVGSLSRVDDWKLDAHGGRWRDCILRCATLLALRTGKRSVADGLNRWRERAEKSEFPFPRNEGFVGRRRELSRLEFTLFGDDANGGGDGGGDYFELKRTRTTRRKNVTLAWGRTNSIDEKRKGKEPIVWTESEKEIQMQKNRTANLDPLPKRGGGGGGAGKKSFRRRPVKAVYGKGIACVSGESGIGKTELLLEFAYRYHQRYRMVLWIGGESRYIRHNYMNLSSFLETEADGNNAHHHHHHHPRSFEEQEEAAIARIRKKLTGNVPFLVVIDNLESEKDWWDHKHVMDLLPRFGGQSHAIISTRLPQVMNLDPLKLSYLSAAEALSLMQQGGNLKDQSNSEFDALRVIEDRLGRLTLGLAIVGAILAELPINPSRLLDTINRASSRVASRENHVLRKNAFLLQLFEVCFSIFDHADGPRSLATRMVLASGWFAPAPIPVPALALAASKVPEKRRHRRRLWRRVLSSLSCRLGSSNSRRSEAEASSLLLRFNMGRACTGEGFIHFNHLVKIYARKRGTHRVAQAMVQALICRGSINLNPDHVWAACFLLLGFGKDPIVVELKVQELLHLVKEVILPLAIRTFVASSRCNVAMELLRLATEALEATDQELVTPVDKWFSKSRCCGPLPTNAQLNPSLWQELALARASVLEVRAKLMLRGVGQLDVGENLVRKAVFIRTSICGDLHQDTVSARETLSKFTRLL
ncbi:hypothetical protein M569_03666, partial [Genlisea aurea]